MLLDFDGTLVDIAPAPDQVHVPATLGPRLAALEGHLGGALALVSGRAVADVDRLLAPYQFALAGVHGAEIRTSGVTRTIDADPARLDPVRDAFQQFTVSHPGTLWEDKRFAVTLHYRQCPEAGPDASDLAVATMRSLDDDIQLLAGKMIVEVRFRAATKGVAVETLMHAPPFAGRIPVYVGDDRTDEDAFIQVNARDGISIVVGAPAESHATYRFDSVPDVHRWIDTLARQLRTQS